MHHKKSFEFFLITKYLGKYHYFTMYFANKFSGFVIALNYKLFPDGSLKNIVHCYPGCP